MRRRERSGCGWLWLILLGLLFGVLGGVILPWSLRTWISGRLPVGLARWSLPPPTPPPTPTPTPTPIPTPTPTPLPVQLVIPPKTREVARLYSGAQVRSSFEAEPGRAASFERETPASYALDLQFFVKMPVASRTLEELNHSAPTLAAALPKLPRLLEKAEVSKFYFGVYQNKTELLRQNLMRLDALLSRDTFYDTDTVLEIQDPDTKRKVLLIQSDMDVDSDGSDPDRVPEVDASDPTFQPLTSYKWPKRTPAVNPLLKTYRERLDRLEGDAKLPNPRKGLATAIENQRNVIGQVERFNSLIARTDPFIVLPGFLARQTGHPFEPKLGDYAVVIAGDKVYPAIFGDIGPSDRFGEASLRLAQAVDPRATAVRSPVADLNITYLVFPGTAEQPFGPPDLGKMRQRCQVLLNEIGGNKAELVEWANLIPTPTPVPVPTASPVSAPVVKPTLSPGAGGPVAAAQSATPKLAVAPSPLPVASASPKTGGAPLSTPSMVPALTPSPTVSPTPGTPLETKK